MFQIPGVHLTDTDQQIINFLATANYATTEVSAFRISLQAKKSISVVYLRLRFLQSQGIVEKSPNGIYHLSRPIEKAWKEEADLMRAKAEVLLRQSKPLILENEKFAEGWANRILKETGTAYTPAELIRYARGETDEEKAADAMIEAASTKEA